MKKTLLSLAVILSFAFYAFSQRTAESTSVIVPNTISADAVISPKDIVATEPKKPITKEVYKDGEYTGPVVDVYYGNLQVKAIISGGKLTDVVFLDYPQNTKHSKDVSNKAMPILKSEAIQIQSENVDIVSGATEVCNGFTESLGAALASAKN